MNDASRSITGPGARLAAAHVLRYRRPAHHAARVPAITGDLT